MGGRKYSTEKEYLLSHIRIHRGHWIWTGGRTGKDCVYGRFEFRYRREVAHRASYRILVGPIPKKHDVHHKCKVKLCIRPKHVEPLTRSEHLKLEPSSKTGPTCKRGHAWNKENTYWNPKGRKICRVCARDAYHKDPKRRHRMEILAQ
jgi:hypothetical protein